MVDFSFNFLPGGRFQGGLPGEVQAPAAPAARAAVRDRHIESGREADRAGPAARGAGEAGREQVLDAEEEQVRLDEVAGGLLRGAVAALGAAAGFLLLRGEQRVPWRRGRLLFRGRLLPFYRVIPR